MIVRYLKSRPFVYRNLRKLYMFLRWKLRGSNQLSRNSYICFRQKFISKELCLGEYSFIGANCIVYPRVRIGKYSMLAPEVSIVGGDHNIDEVGVPMCFSGRPLMPETIIGDDVWIGHRVIVMAGVKIGDGAIVAAGSVVTKDIPPFSIVRGIPAKHMKYRFNEEEWGVHIEALEKGEFGTKTLSSFN